MLKVLIDIDEDLTNSEESVDNYEQDLAINEEIIPFCERRQIYIVWPPLGNNTLDIFCKGNFGLRCSFDGVSCKL